MPNDHLGPRSAGAAGRNKIPAEAHEFELALHETGDSAGPTLSAREQLERDIDAVERAAAALRRADAGLQVWTDDAPARGKRRPRAVWLLIAGIWAVAGLIAAGAIAAMARLIR